MGNIKLVSNARNLEEVTVQGIVSMFESDIDRRRYNVENSIVAEGATASELLSTLPSIQVDERREYFHVREWECGDYISTADPPTYQAMMLKPYWHNSLPVPSRR